MFTAETDSDVSNFIFLRDMSIDRPISFYWPTGGGEGHCGCQDTQTDCQKEGCDCPKIMCECDKSKDGTHTDDGYVTNKADLPVRGVGVGGVGMYFVNSYSRYDKEDFQTNVKHFDIQRWHISKLYCIP